METGFSLKYNISIKGCLILNTLLKIFSIKLFYWYFVNTILMTSSLKFSIKELCHDFVCSFRIDKSSGHNQNIGIIMLSGQVGYFRNPAKSCTDTLMLVQGNSDTFSATGKWRFPDSTRRLLRQWPKDVRNQDSHSCLL